MNISISKLKEIGFNIVENEYSDSHYYFTASTTEEDTKHIKDFIGKNHFKPLGYRILFFGKITNIKDNIPESFWYATSSIDGYYRKYRCRYDYEIEIGNIFASAKTLDECVEKFIHNYINRIYNAHG